MQESSVVPNCPLALINKNNIHWYRNQSNHRLVRSKLDSVARRQLHKTSLRTTNTRQGCKKKWEERSLVVTKIMCTYKLNSLTRCGSELLDECVDMTGKRRRLTLSHVFADCAGNEGLSTSATPLPPHSKKETMRRGRRPAPRMAANTQVKVSVDPGPGKKCRPTNKGEAAQFLMLINMRTRNGEADISPQELFTP